MEMGTTPRDGYDSTPYGYAETMDKMKTAEARNLTAAVAQRLCDQGDGEAMAVIDSLVFALTRGHTKAASVVRTPVDENYPDPWNK